MGQQLDSGNKFIDIGVACLGWVLTAVSGFEFIPAALSGLASLFVIYRSILEIKKLRKK